MITKETAIKIWNCYNEIESAEKVKADMNESKLKYPEEQPSLRNAFGERSGLQLGVPSGSDSHRMFSVKAELALKIVEQHILDQKTRLEELNKVALREIKLTY